MRAWEKKSSGDEQPWRRCLGKKTGGDPSLDFAHSGCVTDGLCDTNDAVGWYFLSV